MALQEALHRGGIGAIEVTAINDGYGERPIEGYVKNAPVAEVQQLMQQLRQPGGRVRVPYNSLVLRTGGKTVLIDAGNGDSGPPTTGAWMDNFVQQSKLLGSKPVIYNVANFTKPAAGQPALLSFDDVVTMFHEFGHALHGMLADGQYPSLSGAQTARDFVEFPSQFNEHWATDPKVFAN